MAYERVNWENLPSKNTPVNADNLNKMDKGIKDLDDLIKEQEKVLTKIKDMIYPVGAVYISVNSTNPANLFGGTWEQIKDRFLLSAGNSYANGSTGGSATHTISVENLPAHTHTYSNATAVQGHTLTVNEIPRHKHNVAGNHGGGGGNYEVPQMLTSKAVDWASNVNDNSIYTGGGQAHNHGLTKANANTSSVGGKKALYTMPPYLAVYVWKRTK